MKKLFTTLVVLLPIITVYVSPIKGVDLGTFIFVIFSFFLIFNRNTKLKIRKPIILYLVYVILSTSISTMLQGELTGIIIILRTGKFIYLIFVIILLGHEGYFDIYYGLKILRTVTLFAVVYIIIQTITYKIFGALLPSGLMSMVTSESYLNNDYYTLAKVLYRPSSFFIEPAYFVQYSFVYLCYSIFGTDNEKVIYKWKEAFFISLGLILSGSGQGILIGLFIWIIWSFKVLFTTKIKFDKKIITVIILLICVIAMPFLLQTEMLSKPLERVFTDNVVGGGNAFLARIEGYQYFYVLPNIYKIIGMGYGNVPDYVYLNSAAYTLYTSGMLGGILVLYIFVDAFRKTKNYKKALIIVYFVMIFGAGTFTAAFICYYFSFIYADIRRAHNNN